MVKNHHNPADRYLRGNVAMLRVPDGIVVVHNNVVPTRRLGTRGFRAWWSEPDDPLITVCDCGWAPELGKHFRVDRRDAMSVWNMPQVKMSAIGDIMPEATDYL